MRFELTESNRHGVRGAAVVSSLIILGAALAFGCADADRASGGDVADQPTTPPPAEPAAAIPAAAVETTPVETPAPSIPTTVAFADGESAYRERDYGRAVALFEVYTGNHPTNGFGYYMLGLSARQAGELDKAEAALQHALELDSTHVKSYFNLGRVYLDRHQPEDARVIIEEGLSRSPTSTDGLRLLARSFDEGGDTESAVDAYRKALVQDPEDAWSMNNLGLILIKGSRPEDALEPLARAAELRDALAVVHNNLGMALELTGHFEAAKQAYRDALAVRPGYEKAQGNLGRIRAFGDRPGLEPVDLQALARSFDEQIARWRDAGEEAESGVAPSIPDAPDSAGVAGLE